jgi:hypothetical protein
MSYKHTPSATRLPAKRERKAEDATVIRRLHPSVQIGAASLRRAHFFRPGSAASP